MRRFIPLLIALVTCFFLPITHTYSNSTIDDVLLRAQEEDKHIFLRFSASWCLPCQMLDEQLDNHPEIVKGINEIYISIELDYDNPKDQDWFILYGIHCLPTMMILDDMGQEIDRLDGSGSIVALQSFLHQNSKHPTDKLAAKDISFVPTPTEKIHTENVVTKSPEKILASSDFYIQFGAFSSFSNAQNLSNTLMTQEEISTIILEESTNGKTFFKVRQILFSEGSNGDTYVKSYKEKGIDCLLKKV